MAEDHDSKSSDEKRLERIERLEQNLYSRRPDLVHRGERRLAPLRGEVRGEWEHPEDNTVTPVAYKPRPQRSYTARLFLLLSFAFFLVAAGVSGYLYFIGENTISADNIDIGIAGPTTVDGGEEISLQIAITNNNSTDLLQTDLIIEYPPGTRSATDMTKEERRVRETIGVIPAGGSIQRIARAVLYGEENSEQKINVGVEYRVIGSNATWNKNKQYGVLLGSAPTGLLISSVKKANAGQEIELVAEVSSNASVVTEDVLLIAEYPFGFTFGSAEPRPTFGTNVWRIGDLPPERKQRVKIKGIITGQSGDERVFRFSTGIQSDANERTVNTPLALALHSIHIERPFIGIDLVVERKNAAEHIASTEKTIRVEVTWQNNVPTIIENAEIEVRLRGDVIDKSSVTTSDGFYRSVDNTVRWDRQTNPQLAGINPGQSGTVSFGFSTHKKGSVALAALRDPTVDLEVTVRGQRVAEVKVPEVIESTVATKILINTDPVVAARLTYTTGPFTNHGPMPPRAEQETTYTATWSLTNSTNDIIEGEVRATLPSYVRWMGVVEPSSESIAYREVGSVIVWDVGTLKAGVGVNTPPREVAFQVALVPSVSQISREIDVVGVLELYGEDRFTGTLIETKTPRQLTTRLSTEPDFNPQHAFVVP